MSRFFVGFILLTIGTATVILNAKFQEWFGRIAWAEEKLGTEGGTRTFYILLGMALIFLSFLFFSGRLFIILNWIFNRG